ncbi:PadR family transcriptional regulator [Roseomonas sp. NAR14]|uniref:PadR family transcriptional regulator n=1 Tax=Roseomonas acroporae TaxID=2937791 RepID=A0A9X1Y7R6_9PROT|nr:PadR family transcriptional regulator [Roseomonas acroporae]MCK8783785.1 PadR family transcriptional regulator [Roseomonas acroporae]
MFGRLRNCGEGRRFARGFMGEGRGEGRGPMGEGRGFGRHGGRERWGGGRGGRFFDHGDLRLVILHLIGEKPRHGYEIIKAVEERLAGAYSPSPGVVYPTLTMLEELGQATVTPEEGGKKLYSITPEGEAALAASRPELDAILARMDAVGGQAGSDPTPRIMRAMHNMKMALRLRLGRGPVDAAELDRIVAAIDAAAAEIERN